MNEQSGNIKPTLAEQVVDILFAMDEAGTPMTEVMRRAVAVEKQLRDTSAEERIKE